MKNKVNFNNYVFFDLLFKCNLKIFISLSAILIKFLLYKSGNEKIVVKIHIKIL